MGRLVAITAENLASCRIMRPVLRELHAELACVVIVPNLPASTTRDRTRFRRLVARASPGFLAFKFAEIHVHHALALPRGGTVRQEAARRGVPVRRYGSIADPRLLADLRAAAPEYILSAGPAILGPQILGVPRVATLNCHCARLPEYRGAANYVWMLLNRERHAYASIQQMELALDEGPLLAERSLPIGPGWSAYRLNHEISGVAGELYAEVARAVLEAGLPAPVERPGAVAANRGFPRRSDLQALRRSGRRLMRTRDVLGCL